MTDRELIDSAREMVRALRKDGRRDVAPTLRRLSDRLELALDDLERVTRERDAWAEIAPMFPSVNLPPGEEPGHSPPAGHPD